MVREKGLEPSRLAALAPKASVSTNSTTRAFDEYFNYSRSIYNNRFILVRLDSRTDTACAIIYLI